MFDAYGTLFDVYSVSALCEQLFPGNGQALAAMWRSKQLQYSLLRSMMNCYRDFWQVTRDALVYTSKCLRLDLTPDKQPAVVTSRPFVNGAATQVRVRLRNGDRHNARVVAEVGAVEAFALGPAAQTWTRYPRLLLRLIQKFFLTAVMLPLAIIGAGLMLRARRWRALVLLLALPLYYMSVQSMLWTEFRYVIAMHYFILILTALTLYRIGSLLWQQTQRLQRKAAV